MYSIRELADLYKTSRQTIYKKIRCEEMKPYVIENENGIKVDSSGLNVLNTIMADSKVADKQLDNKVKQINNDVSRKLTNEVDTNNADYKAIDNPINKETSHTLINGNNSIVIAILQAQIDELKKDKQELQREKQELQMKHDQLVNILINKQKQLEAPTGFFSRLFKASHD